MRRTLVPVAATAIREVQIGPALVDEPSGRRRSGSANHAHRSCEHGVPRARRDAPVGDA
jgi:hypothetical protein